MNVTSPKKDVRGVVLLKHQLHYLNSLETNVANILIEVNIFTEEVCTISSKNKLDRKDAGVSRQSWKSMDLERVKSKSSVVPRFHVIGMEKNSFLCIADKTYLKTHTHTHML